MLLCVYWLTRNALLSLSIKVCLYCANFFDHDFAEMFVTAKSAAAAKDAFVTIEHAHNVSKSDLSTKLMHVQVDDDPLTMCSNSDTGMDVVVKEMAKHEKIAQFEQMKFNTENLLMSLM